MFIEGGSWVGNTIAGLNLGRFWLYQDFAAGSASPLTITTNSNGSGGAFVFDSSKVVDASAVATKTDGNPIFSNTAELSAQLVTTTNTGATVTLSATPAVGEGIIRVWYLYAMSTEDAPDNLEIAPDFVINSRIQFFDARYLQDHNNLSDLTNTATARTNLGFATNTAGLVLIGDGSNLPATDTKLFFNTTSKSLSVNLTAPGTGATLDVGGVTGGIGFPVLTTTERDAITPARNGVIVYNSTANRFDGYVNGAWTAGVGVGTAHSSLTGLTSGDDHTQYALLAGRAGGQTLIGGTAASNSLTLQSTSNGTKGKIIFGASVYDEVNNRLGIGIVTPQADIEITSNGGTAELRLSQVNTNGPTRFMTGASGYLTIQNSAKNILSTDAAGHIGFCTGSPNGPANLDTIIAANQASETTHNTLALLGIASQTGVLLQCYSTGSTVVASISVAGLGKFTGVECLAGSSLKLDGSGSGNITLTSPANPTSYALVLPTAQGAANQALTNDGSGNLSWTGVLSGKAKGGVALSNGSTSKAIVFTTSFGSTNYAISATIVNTTDTDPIHVPLLAIAKAATGFTVEWSDALPTANYTLDWSIVGNNDP